MQVTNDKKYIEFKQNIDNFINKYYKNLLIRGTILFVLLVSVIFLIVTTVEYIAWFNNLGRLFLFLVILVSSLFIFYYFFLQPLLRLLGIFKRITYKKTAEILTTHIPELKDYIFNILELKELKIDDKNYDLINAALLQKIELISKYEFTHAISFKSSKTLLKYLISIFLIYVLMFIFKPHVLIDGSDRIIHFNNYYEKNRGYSIIIDTSKLIVEKGKDLNIGISITGEYIPENLSVFIGKKEFLMEQIDIDSFNINLKSINNSFKFKIGVDKNTSNIYKVKVINPPFLNTFRIEASYPKYTTKSNEIFTQISDIKVPIGTKLKFIFKCNYVDSLFFVNKLKYDKFILNNDKFEYNKKILSSVNYSILAKNRDIERELIQNSFISSIPDLYPQIFTEQKISDKNKRLIYFRGEISDDYGFTKLYFVCNNNKIEIPVNKNITSQEFFFTYEFNVTKLEKYQYYFEIFDNDNVNGFKSTKSKILEFSIPDFKKLIDEKNAQNKEIEKKIEKSLLMINEFKKDINEIKKRMLSDNLSNYEKKQMLKNLQNKQKTLEQLLNELNQQNKEKDNKFNSFNQQNEELLEKQNEIQKLLESVLDEETKKLLEELQKLKNENNLNKNLDKLEMNYENLSEQLDKNLELLKKFEIERDLENISEQLDKISEEQELLASDSIKNSAKTDSLLEKNIKEMDNLKNEFDNLLDKNQQLEKPIKLDDKELSDEFDNLQQSLEDSKNDDSNDNSKKNEKEKKSKFSENSRKAKELSDKIKNSLNNNSNKQSGENAETLRQILENLFYFSFKQEDIYKQMRHTSSTNPIFIKNIKYQKKLKNNFSIIKDSLYELSKRTPYIGNYINKKVFSIEDCLFEIDYSIRDNDFSKLRIEQRTTMQYSNDLILLLSESLKNMQNSGGSSGAESKNKKKKPKKGKPSLSEMRKTQEGMKKQLENMIKDMKSAKNKGGKKSSEQLGKMLAQQEIFQNSLNKLKNSNGVGKEITKQLDEINKLIDRNKRDIINNNITRESLLRQQQIVTRLLEVENSERERDLDEKRESKEALNYKKSNPEDIFNQEKNNIKFDDIIDKNNIKLNYFYRQKYQKYIKNLN
jgi:hypothetical protein